MNKKIIFCLGLAVILSSCNATKSIHKMSVPTDGSTTINIPAKKGKMTDEEIQKWPMADIAKDSIPGMSLDKAYEFISDKKGTTVIVAVIDTGIDINHEDLKDNVWTNTNEIPDNGIDDDNNGYIDDIHGWNFFGGEKGKANPEQLELTRIYKRLNSKFGGKTVEEISKKDKKEYILYTTIKKEFEDLSEKYSKGYEDYLENYEFLKKSDKVAKEQLKKSIYTADDLKTLSSEYQNPILVDVFSSGKNVQDELKRLEYGVNYYKKRITTYYNPDFDGRVAGDNPYDIKDVSYGNEYVSGSLVDEYHGTHVTGTVLAVRDNGIGINGTAKNVKLIAVRAVPNGDEYDKDVALAIRYAVDNGAKVINTSFGKSNSSNPEWVYDALKYAENKDVLIVNSAGNSKKNMDVENVFHNDAPDKVNEISDNVITIGASTRFYDERLVSTFSNYGKINVDIFAPGTKIYSTVPNNEYKFLNGTSMAAPAVAGLAALIRSYYPQLSASQVKHVIMNSGTKINFDVIIPGSEDRKVSFNDLSVSGSIINAYNALLLADRMVNKK